MMKVISSKYVTQELQDAAHFYELEYEGLGRRVKEEVTKAAIRIAQYPEAWSIERGEVRKCLLHKFPYKLLYSIEENHIFVIAVGQQHCKPNYWIKREEHNKALKPRLSQSIDGPESGFSGCVGGSGGSLSKCTVRSDPFAGCVFFTINVL